MGKRRVREEITIFSTSFLDLLFCGLAAVVLLWVLLDPPTVAQEPYRFQYVTVRQKGLWHLAEVRISSGPTLTRLHTTLPPGTTDVPNHRPGGFEGSLATLGAFDPNQYPEYTIAKYDDCKRELESLNIVFNVSDGTKNGFAGSLLLGADERSERRLVTIVFRKCGDTEHVIRLFSQSDSGRSECAFMFQCDPMSPSEVEALILDKPTGRRRVIGNVQRDGGNDMEVLELTFEVDAGRIRLRTPVAMRGAL